MKRNTFTPPVIWGNKARTGTGFAWFKIGQFRTGMGWDVVRIDTVDSERIIAVHCPRRMGAYKTSDQGMKDRSIVKYCGDHRGA